MFLSVEEEMLLEENCENKKKGELISSVELRKRSRNMTFEIELSKEEDYDY